MKFQQVSINVLNPKFSGLGDVVEANDLRDFVLKTHFKEGVEVIPVEVDEIVNSYTKHGNKYSCIGEDVHTILFIVE